MKLTRLEVTDFKKLTALDITLADGVTEIAGKNGAGKSSALDAPWVLLKGLAVAPEEPIHEGAERATIRGTFKGEQVGLIVTRTFTKSESDERGWTSKLEVTNLEGYTSKVSPQAQLNAIIGEHRLDPVEFMNLEPEEQLQAFRAFIPDVDFDAIEAENDKDFKKRTEVGRQADQQEAAAKAIAVPNMTPDDEVDVTALAKEVEEVGNWNAQLEARKQKRKEFAAAIVTKRAGVASMRKAADDHDAQIATLRAQIEELENKAAFTRSAADEEDKLIAADDAKLASAPALPDPKSAALIMVKITDAQTINQNVRAKQQRIAYLTAAAKLDVEYKALTEQMAKRTADMEQKIREAKLPLPNIGFSAKGLTLNGHPFSQASTAERIRTAVALSVALNPELRLMWIRDASLLDDDMLKSIYELAAEYDCQVLLETVRPQSGSAIVLEDGRIAGTPEPVRAEVKPARKKKGTEAESAPMTATEVLARQNPPQIARPSLPQEFPEGEL